MSSGNDSDRSLAIIGCGAVVEEFYAPALKNLAAVALVRSDRAKAIDYLHRYVAREPRDDEARVALDALVRPAAVVAAIPATPMPSPDRIARRAPQRTPEADQE